MRSDINLLFIIVLWATALCSGLVGLWSWRRRKQAGAGILALAAGAVAVMAAGYAIELASGELSTVLGAVRLQYVGIVLLPALWLWFALVYTGYDAVLSGPYRPYLLIIPGLTMALVLTNEAHGLIWQGIDLRIGAGRSIFDPDYGAWFWIHTAYSYSLILAATGLLLRKALRAHRLFRRQALVLIVAALAPLAGNLLYLLRIGPGAWFDLTSLLFGITVFLVALLMARGQLLEVMPLARDLSFEQMRDGVVVLDQQGRIVDFNAAAGGVFKRAASDVIGRPLNALVPDDVIIPERFLTAHEIDEEIAVATSEGRRWFAVKVLPLYGWRGRFKGRLIQWHDVTERRNDEDLLRLRNAELEALHDTAILLSSRHDLAFVLEVIVSRAAELVGAGDGYVAVLDRQAAVMRVRVGIGLFESRVGVELQRNQGLVGQVWDSGQPMLVPNYAAWEHRQLPNDQIGAMFGLPLADADEVVGVIGLCYTERGRTFDPARRALLDRFARLAALALKNAWLYASLEQELTERRRTEIALAQARDAAEASSRAKSTFIGNVSHELRTPLTSIVGYAQLIKLQLASGESELVNGELDIIVQAARHQVDLINDLLDLTKIEAGRMELNQAEFALGQLLEEVAQVVQPLVNRAGNRLVVRAPDDPGVMYGDQQKLRQVLINLLSNAAKFTEQGTIVLEVAHEHAVGHGWLKLSVSDTGIGIPAAFLNTIFEEFGQVTGPRRQKYGGTGLGLALCARYVELMGGRIVVESEEHKGSCFTVTLPFVQALAVNHGGERTLGASRDQLSRP